MAASAVTAKMYGPALARAILLLLLCCTAACAGRAQRPEDPLVSLNQLLRADYAAARDRGLAAAGPVLIAGPDKLTLLRGQAREVAELDPPGYHELKAVAHVPLGLHALIADGQLGEQRLLALRRLVPPLEKARATLARHGLTDEQIARSEALIDASLELIDRVVATRSAEPLAAFEHAVAPLLLEHARDAARLQLDLLHRSVQAFREELGEAGFAALHVVIISAHMPREGQLALQYFQRLLREPEGLRIVYAEGLWEEPKALQLLATHLIDSQIAAGFFDEPRRLHRDLLADAAAEYLPTLLP